MIQTTRYSIKSQFNTWCNSQFQDREVRINSSCPNPDDANIMVACNVTNLPGLLARPVALMKRPPLLLAFFLFFFAIFVSWSESVEVELLLEPLSLPEELDSLWAKAIRIVFFTLGT